MSAQIDLLTWIKTQENAGSVDSSGVFTVEKNRAWEKLGAFALPFPEAWVLKVVQSAVRAGSALSVEQARAETVFRWETNPNWSHEAVEKAILDPEPDSDPALEHLAVGLRALAKSAELPFALDYSDGSRAIWTGQGFRLDSGDLTEGADFCLAVCHFKVGESKFFLSWDNLDAKRRSSAIAKTLSSRAHWSPSPVVLDGRTINNVFGDPVFGASDLRHPLFLFQAPAQPNTPAFQVHAKFYRPDTTFTGAPELTGAPNEIRAITQAWAEQPSFAIGLISAFVKKRRSGKHNVYEASRQASQFVWLADGVEVQRDELPLGESPAALLVACSADGLETDISGLIPRQTENLEQRKRAALQAIGGQVLDLSSNLDAEISGVTHISKGVMLVGALLLLAAPPVGIMLVGAGGIGMMIEQGQRDSLENSVDEGLKKLQDKLRSLPGL
jgi:hypothetical protein